MLSEMPEGWKLAKLSDISEIKIGGTPSRSSPEYWANGSEGYTWASIADLKQGVVTDSKEKITQLGVEKSNVKHVSAGTVLMSFKLTVGRVAIAGTDLYTNEAIAAFNLNNGVVERDFLYQYLPTFVDMVETEQAVKGKTLNKKSLADVPVILPPLDEQRRIAEVLSSVDASIQATQAVIQQCERVKRGLMEELLTGGLGSEAIERGEVPEGWVSASLGDVGKLYAGGTPDRKTQKFYEPAEVAWVKSGELRQGRITNTEECISRLGLERSSAKLVPADTPVLAMYGATAGQVGWLTMEAATNQAVLACVPKSISDGKFLYFSLKNASQSLIARQQGGAQPNLSKNLVSSFDIALPPLNEQRRIAEILSSVDDSIGKQKSIVAQQARTKNGLMDDLLTGKVRTV